MMVVHRRKKKVKQRGHKTHGWGSKKKHRGAGNRGGRGMAGTGKRGDQKKPSIWAKRYFGKRGFKPKGIIRKAVNPVNLLVIEAKIDEWLQKGVAKKVDDVYEVDVRKLGYDKVLGYGKLTRKYKIIAPAFSEKAGKKLKSAGGEAVVEK